MYRKLGIILIGLFLIFPVLADKDSVEKPQALSGADSVTQIVNNFDSIYQIFLKKGLSLQDKADLEKTTLEASEALEGLTKTGEENPGKHETEEKLNRILKVSLGMRMNLIWILPFLTLLLLIAIGPLFFHHFWDKNSNKGLLCLLLSLPVAFFIISTGPHILIHTAREYVSFLILLASLFIISGGIYVHGTTKTSLRLNMAFLFTGAIFANVIGTTGTAMVLIRPLIRANLHRKHKAHLIIFFTFIVCNCAGLLTPLGDPPLFLGFLRGVPFLWTLRLFPQWLFVNGCLFALFYFFERHFLKKEEASTGAKEDGKMKIKIDGKINFLFLAGVVLSAFLSGAFSLPFGIQEAGMAAMAILSLLFTPLSSNERKHNGFTFVAINEVAILFAGIFVTMIPCLLILEAWGQKLPLTDPSQFFWMSGFLSSFLDNAPTYLTFSTLASSVAGADPAHLNELAGSLHASVNLAAVSCGSVFMGANTYIGNAPNFMVKSIASEHGIPMPGFFGYMLWSGAILIPVFLLCTFLFF